ncbi:uncharacterized protein LOC110037283 [Phalaenopsis equestris]|uniref:uncharacterized protein LOC110037283 n=1 Tax=Phalaenopsis equestris TaxID=78828 RepID=UPI0009E62A36|nr:uncharacterized protein LOC110037283 [Phalaenopsis equestris]
MDLVRSFFDSLNFIGQWKLGLVDRRHLLIQLTMEQDYARLFAKQAASISGVTMKIQKWTRDFDPTKEPPVVPIWFKLPGLLLPYFKLNALFNIGRALGTPLKVDAPTFNMARPALARIQVERDITLPEIKRIWIGSDQEGFCQDIITEQKPFYCQHCKMFGHTVEKCYRLHPPTKKLSMNPRVASQASNQGQSNHTTIINHKETVRQTSKTPSDKNTNPPATFPSRDPLGKLSEPHNNLKSSTGCMVRAEPNEVRIITPPSPTLAEKGKCVLENPLFTEDDTDEAAVVEVQQDLGADRQSQKIRKKNVMKSSPINEATPSIAEADIMDL